MPTQTNNSLARSVMRQMLSSVAAAGFLTAASNVNLKRFRINEFFKKQSASF